METSPQTDSDERVYLPVRFPCPKCGTPVVVVQSQGDLCPTCGFEYKWFLPHEHEPARDFHAAVSGETYLTELPDGGGWIVAHG